MGVQEVLSIFYSNSPYTNRQDFLDIIGVAAKYTGTCNAWIVPHKLFP